MPHSSNPVRLSRWIRTFNRGGQLWMLAERRATAGGPVRGAYCQDELPGFDHARIREGLFSS